MIVVMGRWKQKLIKFLGILVLIAAFVVAVPAITGLLVKQVPALRVVARRTSTGNPMRVEADENAGSFKPNTGSICYQTAGFYYER